MLPKFGPGGAKILLHNPIVTRGEEREVTNFEATVPKPELGGSTQASNHALNEVFASLHQSAAASYRRDGGDSEIDTSWINKDKKSLELAAKIGQMSEDLQSYISGGGNFTDAKGREMASGFIKQLRRDRDDYVQDRGDANSGALQYTGTDGHNNPTIVPDEKIEASLTANQQIANAAKMLAENPNLSPDERSKQLQIVNAAITEIGTQLGDRRRAGKDQMDTLAERGAIATDLSALSSGQLTADQQNLMYRDIRSKSGLIADQLGDLRNETAEAVHDSAAIKLGADTEAYLNYALRHFGHSAGAMRQLSDALDRMHKKDNSGVVDFVAADRRLDFSTEGLYSQHNRDDARQVDLPILQLTKGS